MTGLKGKTSTGTRRKRVDSWKGQMNGRKLSRVTATSSLTDRLPPGPPAPLPTPVRAVAGTSHDPFAKEAPSGYVEMRIAASRVPDLEDRARRAENSEIRILSQIDRERRERRALAAVALLLGLGVMGWRLHTADQLVTAAQDEVQRVSLERDQARTHVAGLTAETDVLRETLRDEQGLTARTQIKLENVTIELERGERAARAFGETFAKIVRGR